jgi:hypothetical protein
MPRRSVRAGKKGYGDPVYTWAFRSSQTRGGQIITYETRLEEDGVIRCNCPGWIFCKGEPAEKICKHKTAIAHEAPGILASFRRGEELPVYNVEQPIQGTVSGRVSSSGQNISNPPRSESDARARPTDSALRRGRVIVMD